MMIESIPFTVRGTIFNALKSLAVKAHEKSLSLAFEVDSTVPDYVVGDSFRLRQIVLNSLEMPSSSQIMAKSR